MLTFDNGAGEAGDVFSHTHRFEAGQWAISSIQLVNRLAV